MTNIREYNEESKVKIVKLSPEHGEKYKKAMSEGSYNAHIEQRHAIIALNEGGNNSTKVDLIDVLKFVKNNLPEIWNNIDKME